MGLPAAHATHTVVGVDTHIVLVPTAGGPVPTPLPHPFNGVLDGGLVATVTIAGQAAAVVGSTATNQPAHVPTPPGASFQVPPANRATVQVGSTTVRIGGQGAARSTDTCLTCNDPSDAPVGQIVATGTVSIG